MDYLESRVTDLEIHLSHQAKMLDELNSVLISQQKKLNKLEKFNTLMIQHLSISIDSTNGSIIDRYDTKPPHY